MKNRGTPSCKMPIDYAFSNTATAMYTKHTTHRFIPTNSQSFTQTYEREVLILWDLLNVGLQGLDRSDFTLFEHQLTMLAFQKFPPYSKSPITHTQLQQSILI
jgi:hypothetical protein